MSLDLRDRPPVTSSAAPAPSSEVPPVVVEALRAGDREPVLQVFAGLSDHSRNQRFHTGTHRLTGSMLAQLTGLRTGHHEAFVAQVGGRAVGIARWVREREGGDVAELACEVVDAHHGHGVGRRLVAAAAVSAARRGVARLRCQVLIGGPAHLALRGHGIRTGEQVGGVLEVLVPARLLASIADAAGDLAGSSGDEA